MNNKKRIHVFASGRVQGVFFRASTRKRARELGLTGWVKNLPDGRVEAVFEGTNGGIKEMIEWMRHGPPLARVKNLEVEHSSFQGEFKDFKIRR